MTETVGFYMITASVMTLQTDHVDFTLKLRGNCRFHVVLTWNPRGVFVGERVKQASCCASTMLADSNIQFQRNF